MTTQYDQLLEVKEFLFEKGMTQPEMGLILGSGLGELATEIEDAISIEYKDIPHFPVSTVVGHAGRLVYGKLSGKYVLVMDGRFHFYEGYSMETVTFPARLMKVLGIHTMLVTNSAGGSNKSYKPGDLMMITDHLNLTGTNPLIGKNDDRFGPRFPDMSDTYDKKGQEVIRAAAKELNIDLKEGVYGGFSGPTYETPAEVRMAQVLGCDAVGMSTVPEAIIANHAGLHILGISCITNMAAGLQKSLNHEEVVATTTRVKESFKGLVKLIIANYDVTKM